jgi:arylsulfatase A
MTFSREPTMYRSLLLLLLFPFGAIAAEKPNVVLILIDDYGWRDVGCYGSTFYKTPNIDRLAKEGVRFTDGYAACPVCSPTRAAIMTGRYPQRTGITDWLPGRADGPQHKLSRPTLPDHLPKGTITFADVFRKAGYVTGHIGKWHLGGEGHSPTNHGFDVNIAGDHTGTPLSYFAPFGNKVRKMPGLEEAPQGEYLPDRLAAEAVKFIEKNKEKPFFLYLPHYSVHTPLRAKKEMIEQYKQGRPGTQANPTYAAMVESMDAAVGTVLKALEERKLSEKTLVIFTSDNGGLATTEGAINGLPATINSPLREGKGWLYEGGVRVPLIVKAPGLKGGIVSDALAGSVDFLPTAVEYCGITSEVKSDGVSLVSVLKGEAAKPRDLFWHYPHYANQGSRPGGAVRSGEWKFIEFYETGRRELFNVKKDLSESRNIAAENPKIVQELAEKLATWRTEVGAKMPLPNPGYEPNSQGKNGQISLPAQWATVHGSMLRFEPLPHKNTLGFWVNPKDYATWELTVKEPGTFAVELTHGCGKGSGGSEVEFAIGDSKFTYTVKETGGFQTWSTNKIGELKIDKAGRHTLSVTPLKKPGVAVMDIQLIILKPVKN